MSLLRMLQDPDVWSDYLSYKSAGGHLSKSEAADLSHFIDNAEYMPVASRLISGGSFSLPSKRQIAKSGTSKKRTVYTFPREENYAQKLLSHLLSRRYDCVFCDNLYSFRAGRGISRAVDDVLAIPSPDSRFTYKADISNYFNSIDPVRMVDMLRNLLSDDPDTLRVLSDMLTSSLAIEDGRTVSEPKGVMAGTPVSVFFANLYLSDLDRSFEGSDIMYARYSDDILILADSEERLETGIEHIREALAAKGLSVNPDKEQRTVPGEPWSFLGIVYRGGVIDISDVSKDKLKAKIRRKARSIKRWQVRRSLVPEAAVRAFIKSLNRKYFSEGFNRDLTWARWYFPVINTDVTLRELDAYAQSWVRFLATDTHSSGAYSYRYSDMKSMGYRSLVHEWYLFRECRK